MNIDDAVYSQPWPKAQSIIDKEYKTLYLTENYHISDERGTAKNDVYFHLHLSGICAVGLAPSHPIVANNLSVVSISWPSLGPTNRITLSGKRKTGARKLSPGQHLCHLKCSDGSAYRIVAHIRGRLIDINPQFQVAALSGEDNQKGKQNRRKNNKNQQNDPASSQPVNPEQLRLLTTDPLHSGYLCMFLLTPLEMQLMLVQFQRQKQYLRFVAARQAAISSISASRSPDQDVSQDAQPVVTEQPPIEQTDERETPAPPQTEPPQPSIDTTETSN